MIEHGFRVQDLVGCARDDVPDQGLLPGGAFTYVDHRMLDARVPAERPFDLAWLDPHSVDLQLAVEAPQEFHGAVRALAHSVTGAVHPQALLGRAYVATKTLSCEGRRTQVAQRNPGAADP